MPFHAGEVSIIGRDEELGDHRPVAVLRRIPARIGADPVLKSHLHHEIHEKIVGSVRHRDIRKPHGPLISFLIIFNIAEKLQRVHAVSEAKIRLLLLHGLKLSRPGGVNGEHTVRIRGCVCCKRTRGQKLPSDALSESPVLIFRNHGRSAEGGKAQIDRRRPADLQIKDPRKEDRARFIRTRIDIGPVKKPLLPELLLNQLLVRCRIAVLRRIILRNRERIEDPVPEKTYAP